MRWPRAPNTIFGSELMGFGLQHFNTKTAKFTTFGSSDASGSLSDSEVNWVHVARTGAVWVATLNGLNEFDPATKHFTVYDAHDGLASSAVDCVLEDARGKLWMNTDKGISSFDPSTKTFRNFSTAEGLPGPRDGWCGRLPARRRAGGCFLPDSAERQRSFPTLFRKATTRPQP